MEVRSCCDYWSDSNPDRNHFGELSWKWENLWRSLKWNRLQYRYLSRLNMRKMMPKIRFDPSEIPLHRKNPRRLEQPLQGYRAWKVVRVPEEGWMLKSLVAHVFWPGPVLRADVKPFDPEYWDSLRGPDSNVMPRKEALWTWTSGIYALKTEKLVHQAVRSYNGDAYGLVDLWGRVVEFKLGYRAELCQVRWLVMRPRVISADKIFSRPPTWWPRNSAEFSECVRDLENRYQCDVETRKDFRHAIGS